MKTKLFCITYAGGSANAYAVWKNYLSDDVEMVPVELAGRGKRMGEPFYSSWKEAADDVYSAIRNSLREGEEYAVYGHSMGCWIAFEVLDMIRKNHDSQPVTAYFSANTPPHLESGEEKISFLDDDEFAEKIVELGDTPPEIMKGELRNFFLPVLRADYRLVEMYDHKDRNVAFDYDIHVLYGEKDTTEKNDLMEWQKYTNKGFHIHGFSGGHMFFRDDAPETTDYINRTISN